MSNIGVILEQTLLHGNLDKMKNVKAQKITINIGLWILSGIIYICTTYAAYKFFHGYVHLRNMWLILGVMSIMLCWLWLIWLVLYGYDYFSARINKKNPPQENTELPSVSDKQEIETRAPEEKVAFSANTETEILPEKKEKKTVSREESLEKKRDKNIHKRYQEVIKEYKKTLSETDYKKFEELTRYDTLLYDALMVSRDKEWKLLSKLENEKWSVYISAITKILG